MPSSSSGKGSKSISGAEYTVPINMHMYCGWTFCTLEFTVYYGDQHDNKDSFWRWEGVCGKASSLCTTILFFIHLSCTFIDTKPVHCFNTSLESVTIMISLDWMADMSDCTILSYWSSGILLRFHPGIHEKPRHPQLVPVWSSIYLSVYVDISPSRHIIATVEHHAVTET